MNDSILPEIPQETIERCEKTIEVIKNAILMTFDSIKPIYNCLTNIAQNFYIAYSNAPTKRKHLYRYSKKRRVRKKYESMIFSRGCT